MERAIQEFQMQIQTINTGMVGASTVAGTDYICGNSGAGSGTDFNNDDGVNIGSNDGNDDSALIMNIDQQRQYQKLKNS